MPSYPLFNHKAGSVSSIYSTFWVFDIDINLVIRYSNLSSSRTGRRSRFAPRRFRTLTEDEGGYRATEQIPEEEDCFGERNFPISASSRDTISGTFGGTPDFREARGTHQKSTRGLNLCFVKALSYSVLYCVVYILFV